ncbi:GNAT family N-acetyltransferase [Brachybacterium huguangmaarense]|uniref:GNAT family N-acetyltransferase n=1 Tax=Brachybacterium huguangmaarense TaxID=1652028 RepID=A0ABY6G3P0_9MICO|nr:GNAT family N-acetyltransferase [Brachybacterium huguangmaarense]UYG17727.1 GNAT family N-acetyltransferase [Brachybacterium huguangmaarense]
MTARFTIDLPVLADAPALAAVHVQAWREAYAGLLPATFFDEAARERREQMWTATLSTSSPATIRERLRIARDARGTAAGFLLVGDARDDDAPVPLELQALNLATALYGSGAARALVTELLGDRAAYLWVADPNPRAQRFYAKVGFVPDGAEKRDPGLEDLREIRMTRLVTSRS